MLTQADVRDAYLERIAGDVKLARPMKIVIDCGNGVAGAIAPQLFRRLGLRGARNCSARSTATSPTTIPIRPSRRTCRT